jgi:hypothetical protein
MLPTRPVMIRPLAALRSESPYPLLAISGEQGSAKTVLSKLLKALIDPNTAPVRALARGFFAHPAPSRVRTRQTAGRRPIP